jgi:iron(III) transport system permease protein
LIRTAPIVRPRRAWLNVENCVSGAAVLALIVLVVLPLASLVWGSLWTGHGVGAANFVEVLSHRLYFDALVNSLTLGAWTALLSIVIGVPLAWAVIRTDLPGRQFVNLTATLSYLSPPFLVAIAYVNLFSPRAGVINAFLHHATGSSSFTFNIFSMPGLVLVTVLHTFPFVYLLTSSALASVDASYEESAQILGAGKLRTLWSVTFPLVAPAILSGALIGFVNAIALFGSQAIIGLPARIFTLPTRIYALFDYPPEYGLASALSLVFVAITVLALYFQRSYLARRSYVTLAGKGARLQRLTLGALRWPLFAFCVGIFIIAVFLPYASLLAVSFSKSWGLDFWKNLTLKNYHFILFEYDVTRRAIVNSALLATLAATFCVIVGTAIGWIDLRTRFIGRKFVDYVSLIPLGLPGIVMAAALIQFWLRLPLHLYGTLAILFLAYAARYLPLGVRSANAAMRQIDPSLEESARILGASWSLTAREITLPLMRSGLFAGWILIFVPAIQELSASILLFSSKSMTLAVAVYNLYENGYIEPVAALALINAAIIGIAILIANKAGGGATRFESTSN